MNNELKKFNRNIIWITSSKVSYLLLNFAYTVHIARIFGAQKFGQYIYWYSILTFLTIVILLGNRNGLQYYIARLRAQAKDLELKRLITSTILAIGLISILVMAIISIVIEMWISVTYGIGIDRELIIITTLLIVLEALVELIKIILRGFGQIKIFSLIDNLNIVSRFALITMIFSSDKSTNEIVYANLFSTLPIILTMLYVMNKRGMLIRIELRDMRIFFEMSRKFITSAYSYVVNISSQRVGRLVIGIFVGTKDVGIYHVALTVANTTSLVMNAINIVITPIFASTILRNDDESLAYLFKKSAFISSSLNLILTILVVVKGDVLLAMYGEDFKVGYKSLVIICVAQFVNSLSGSVLQLVMMNGDSGRVFKIHVTSLVLGLLVLLLTIEPLGIEGAALAYSVNIIVANLLGVVYVKKCFGMISLSKQMIYEWIIVGLSAMAVFGHDSISIIVENQYLSSFLEIMIFVLMIIVVNVILIKRNLITFRFSEQR